MSDIKTRPATPEYRSGYDRVFGPKLEISPTEVAGLLGEVCPDCRGEGCFWEHDLATGWPSSTPCTNCNGVGKVVLPDPEA